MSQNKLNTDQRRAALAELLKNGKTVSLSMAEEYDVAERTIRRDVEFLGSLGAIIKKDETRKKSYRLLNLGWTPYLTRATGRKYELLDDLSKEIRQRIPSDKRKFFIDEIHALDSKDQRIVIISLMKGMIKAKAGESIEAEYLLSQLARTLIKERVTETEKQIKHLFQVLETIRSLVRGQLKGAVKPKPQQPEPPIGFLMSFDLSSITLPTPAEPVQYPEWIEQIGQLAPEDLQYVINAV